MTQEFTGEAIGLEVVGVHVPVALVDVIGIAKAGVARRGVGVVAHIVLVDVGAYHVVCVHELNDQNRPHHALHLVLCKRI